MGGAVNRNLLRLMLYLLMRDAAPTGMVTTAVNETIAYARQGMTAVYSDTHLEALADALALKMIDSLGLDPQQAEYRRDLNGEAIMVIRDICKEHGGHEAAFADDCVRLLAAERDELRAALDAKEATG